MKRIIRSFLCCFCFFLFGIGGLVMGTLVFPIILIFFNKQRQQHYLSTSIHYTWRIFVWLMTTLRLISVKITDTTKLNQLRGHIVIANHPSLIDVVILVSCVPKSICVVKDKLFHNFFIKNVIQRIYLSNSMSPDEFLTKGSEFLSKGYNIIIFPEGTRTVHNRPIRFHRGFAYLQIHSTAPILPVHIKNTPPILGKMQPWHNIGSKTSVYTLTPLAEIQDSTPGTQTKRQAAIDITNRAKNALFPKDFS